jgi:hypothetical protein
MAALAADVPEPFDKPGGNLEHQRTVATRWRCQSPPSTECLNRANRLWAMIPMRKNSALASKLPAGRRSMPKPIFSSLMPLSETSPRWRYRTSVASSRIALMPLSVGPSRRPPMAGLTSLFAVVEDVRLISRRIEAHAGYCVPSWTNVFHSPG